MQMIFMNFVQESVNIILNFIQKYFALVMVVDSYFLFLVVLLEI